MKTTIQICFLTLISIPLIGQKVKYKKGKVYIDKVESYIFEQTSKGAFRFGIPLEYAFRDLDGNDIFTIEDSVFTFTPLPHEDGKRTSFHCAVLVCKKHNTRALVQTIGTFSPRKSMTKFLNEEGFFNTGDFTVELFDKFIERAGTGNYEKNFEYHQRVNVNRVNNAESMVAEYGPFPKRKPTKVRVKERKITDGDVVLGYFKMETKGTVSHVYELFNTNDVRIGLTVFDIHDNRANAYTLVDEFREWRPFNRSGIGEVKTEDQKLLIFAKYLVEFGYL